MKAGLILENENGEYLLLKISEQSKELAAKRKCFCRVFMDIECNIPKMIGDKPAIQLLDIDKCNQLLQVGHVDYKGNYWQNANSIK